MAELIKREDAIDVLKETGIIQDNDLGHLVVEEIERIPTTTEAEIRAKAIDEFAKALLANEVVDKSVVRRVAEQLKEE